MNEQTANQTQEAELDLESDAPLAQPACPLNPDDREGCEACQ